MAKKLKNWNEVDNQLKQLSELEYQKSRLEADKNLKFSTYETAYNEEYAPIAQQMSEITENIGAFLNENKTEFDKAKTKKLPNGTISCKASSKLDIPDESKTMELLRKMNLNACIRVVESLNKDIIKSLDEKTLKKAKVSIVNDSKFTIKTNQAELKAV